MKNKILLKTNKVIYNDAKLFIKDKPKIIHSKNPFLIIQPKLEKTKPLKSIPLNGVEILKICKCELPKEILKIDISGYNYCKVDKDELKYFVNILEIDASDNNLEINDFDVFGKLNKLTWQSNNLNNINYIKYIFTDLEYLDLSFNNISPNSLIELTKMENLKELKLVNNNLTELCEEFTELNLLESLNLSFNNFDKYTNLEEFWKILGGLRNLKNLDLGNNKINGVHTNKLTSNSFKKLDILDLRNNFINNQMNIICCRNFISLKRLVITGNSFTKQNYNYLENEIKIRLGAQVINETIKNYIKKKKDEKFKLVYDKLIIVKDKEIKKNDTNNEFFGVEILNKTESFTNYKPLVTEKKEEEEEDPNNFYLTEIDKDKNKEFNKKIDLDDFDLISKINFNKEFNYKELNNIQLMGISKITLGSMIEYDKIKSLNEAYKALKILTYDKKPYNFSFNKYKIK